MDNCYAPADPALNRLFHALADPTRRAVLHRLGRGPASVGDLAGPFGMALPSFLKHITVLEHAGLIGSVKRGRVRTCRIVPERMAEAEDWLADQRALWQGRSDRMAQYVENLARQEREP